MSTSGNTVQATILLDSGAFMTDEDATGKTHSEVGYFIPHIVIYVDGEKVREVTPGEITGGELIEVKKLDDSDNEVDSGITLSGCLVKHLLRLDKVYGKVIDADRTKFDCIFDFKTGHFCSSKIRERNFREYEATSGQQTPNLKSLGTIAHDVSVQMGLQPTQRLYVGSQKVGIWPYPDSPTPTRRIDIEILAANSTTKSYYCDCLKLYGANYWLPNQGDPPPTWTHGGQGGAGG